MSSFRLPQSIRGSLRIDPCRPRNGEGSEWHSCNWEREMKPTTRTRIAPLMLLSALALCLSAAAQQSAPAVAQRLQSYDLSREVFLVGAVVKFDPASATPPIGAHV